MQLIDILNNPYLIRLKSIMDVPKQEIVEEVSAVKG